MRVVVALALAVGAGAIAQEKKPEPPKTPSGLGTIVCALPEERPSYGTFQAHDLPPPDKPGFASQELFPGFEYVAPEEAVPGEPGSREGATAQAKAWLSSALGAELAGSFAHVETRATELEGDDGAVKTRAGTWDVVFAQQVGGIPIMNTSLVWIDRGVVARASVQGVSVKEPVDAKKPVVAAADAVAAVDKKLAGKKRPYKVTRVRLLWTFDQRIDQDDETITPHSLSWKVELEDVETKRKGALFVHGDTGEVWENE